MVCYCPVSNCNEFAIELFLLGGRCDMVPLPHVKKF